MNTHYASAALLASSIAVAALAAPAAASGGVDPVVRTGSCTGTTDWKIKAKSDNGRIEVEAEIDSNRVGQTWTWRFKHNGVVFSRGTSTTRAPSGSFSVGRRPANLAGTDHFVFRAVNPRTGEVCRATVSW